MSDYNIVVAYVTGKYYSKKVARNLGIAAIFGTIVNNISIIMSVMIDVSHNLSVFLDIDTLTIKIVFTIFQVFLTAYALEPERLKPFAFLCGIGLIVMLLLMYLNNLFLLIPSEMDPSATHINFNIKNTGIFVGMAGWAYEACGTIFTVKQSMKYPEELPGLVKLCFIFIGILYMMFSLSFNFAYGNNNLKSDAFQYYPIETNPYMFSGCLVIFVLLTLFVPLYNISNCELLEEFNWAHDYIYKKGNSIKKSRLFTFRAIAIVASCALAYLTDEVSVVLNLAGAIVIPIISFYLPMLMNRVHAKVYKIKISWFWKIHDSIIAILGVGVQVFALWYSIENQLLGNPVD